VGTRGRSDKSEFVNQDAGLGRNASAIKGLKKSASFCFEDG